MTNGRAKGAVAVVIMAGAVLFASAEEVSADSAGIAAQHWLQDDAALGCSLGSEVASVRTCSPQADASFHVVKLKGGGFVVMSSDTTREPVVAFSSGGDFVESDANPMWVLLKKDLALRVEANAAASGKSKLLNATASGTSSSANEAKWSRLLTRSKLLRTSQGVSSVSDIRVAPLVQSKWSQDSVGGSVCYNYYTPSHYVCGCVATAGAQIMRYFEWPLASVNVANFTNKYCYLKTTQKTYTTKGGYYDWSLMPLVPDGSITEAQRQAIGKLTSDIGICVGMRYNTVANGGSSACGYMLAEAFTNRYGYANALAVESKSDISGSESTKNALLSNFDAGLPVAIGLSGDGGHEIVGDGYGYSENTLYLHFNMGWSGIDDAWYAPPNMAGTQCDFSVLDGYVCNVFTNSADKGGVICSGRVLDASGAPIANAVVSAKKSGTVVKSATTNAKGIYAFVLPADSYVLSASSGGSSATKGVTLNSNVGIKIYTAQNSNFGKYDPTSVPIIGNLCGQDITITDVEGVAEPQFNPASCLFYPYTNIAITCATEGAVIRYTTDGTDPTESSRIYVSQIRVEDDVTIKARAWKSGKNPSAIVAETYTYDSSQGAPKGDYFDNPINISGTAGSRVIDDNSDFTVEPGEPLHTQRSTGGGGYTYNYQYRTGWYKWTAPGSGTMTFTTSSSGGGYVYPTFIAIYTGDTLTLDNRQAFAYEYDETTYITTLSFGVEQGVTYRIVGMMGYDAGAEFVLTWSGDLTVVPTETSTTEIPVTYVWLDQYFPGSASSTNDYETIAKADADGDGLDTWAEYLLGTDPTNASSRLVATIRMDGSMPIVESNADTNRLANFGYQPVVKGKQALDSAVDWANVDSLLHRFFKVFVERR
ncbi:MAG: C10 family peptidase [Kiritimatiellae bacterium]|nr:C10 family peptidase [Kiritimatiellia bacterium]